MIKGIKKWAMFMSKRQRLKQVVDLFLTEIIGLIFVFLMIQDYNEIEPMVGVIVFVGWQIYSFSASRHAAYPKSKNNLSEFLSFIFFIAAGWLSLMVLCFGNHLYYSTWINCFFIVALITKIAAIIHQYNYESLLYIDEEQTRCNIFSKSHNDTIGMFYSCDLNKPQTKCEYYTYGCGKKIGSCMKSSVLSDGATCVCLSTNCQKDWEQKLEKEWK
jgi:hypothetical protein